MSALRAESKLSPQLNVQLPSSVGAWERVTVTLVAGNTTRQPILPTSIELRSAHGLIREWSIENASADWGVLVPAGRTGSGLEVLSGSSAPQQRVAPPSPVDRAVNALLARIKPLMPGAALEVSTSFVASYEHGDRLDAMLMYITLDPQSRMICAAPESTEPSRFVECRRVSGVEERAGLQLYVPEEELKRDVESVNHAAALAVRHPAFDIADARARTGVASGVFGYEATTGHWIVVDEPSSRTLMVGDQGIVEELPGDWLDLLIGLGQGGQSSITWNTDAVPLTDAARRALAEAEIRVASFTHKDYASSSHVVLTVNRGQVKTLARLLREIGAKLDGHNVVK